MSNVKLELFNEKGEPLFLSNGYKPINVITGVKMGRVYDLAYHRVLNKWTFKVDFNFTLKTNQMIMLTPLGTLYTFNNYPIGVASLEKYYATSMTRQQVEDDLNSDCLIMEY